MANGILKSPACVRCGLLLVLLTAACAQQGESSPPAWGSQRSAVSGTTPQTIAVGSISAKAMGDAPFDLSATSSSGETVTFSYVFGPVSLSGSTVTITGAGAVQLTASVPGDATYAPASQSISFTIAKGTPNLVFPQPGAHIVTEGTFPLNVTTTPGSPPVQFFFQAGTTAYGGVNGDTYNILGRVGTVTLLALQEASSNWNSVQVERTFTIDKRPQTITFSGISNPQRWPSVLAIAATATTDAPLPGPLIQTVSGPVKPAVSSSGRIVLEATGVGLVTLRVTCTGNSFWADYDALHTFEFTKASQTITFFPFTNKTFPVNPAPGISGAVTSELPMTFTVTGPATLNGYLLNVTGAGTVSVTATQDGNDLWLPAAPVTQSFEVLKGTPTITCSNLTGKAWNDPGFDPGCKSSGGDPAQLSIVSGPATIQNGLVVPNELGTVVLQASVPETANYVAASTNVNITIGRATSPLSYVDTGPYKFNTTFQLSVTKAAGSPPLQFAYNGGVACQVTQDGLVTPLAGTGTLNLRVTQTANTYWLGTALEYSIQIQPGDPTLTITGISNPQPFQLQALAPIAKTTFNRAATLALESGPATYVNGLLTLTDIGTVVLRATAPAYTGLNPLDQLVSYSIVPGNQSITFAAPANQTFGAAPITLGATASSGLPVSYSVTGSASLNGNVLTLTGIGSVTITASQPGDSKWNAATSVPRTFTVAPGAPTITCTNTTQAWNSPPFNPSCTSNTGQPVTLTFVSGPATVDGTLVAPIDMGSVILNASTTAGGNYTAGTRSVAVTIGPATPALVLDNPGTHTFDEGHFTLHARSSPGSPRIQYLLSQPIGGTGAEQGVNDNEVYFGLAPPVSLPVSVTATAYQYDDAGRWSYTKAEQTFRVEKGISRFFFTDASQTSLPATFPYTAQPTRVLCYWGRARENAYGILPCEVVSGPASYQGGFLVLRGAGTVRLRATYDGGGSWAPYFNAGQGEFEFVVTTGVQSITFPPIADHHNGDAPFRINASADSGLPITYTVSGPATVVENLVTVTGTGTVTITANQVGSSLFSAAAPVSRTFNVGPGAQTIVVQAPAALRYGDPPFTPTATTQSGLPVSFQIVSGPGTVVNNKISTTGLGTVQVRASVAGNASWDAATTTFSFDVLKGKPRLLLEPIATQNYAAGSVALVATSGNPGPITYEAVSGPITVSSGRATFTGRGTATVRVSQPEDALWLAASIEQSFSITAGTVSFTIGGYENPQPFQLEPLAIQVQGTGGRSGTLSLVSGPATLQGTHLTLTGLGTIELLVTDPGTSEIPPSQQSASFRVVPGNQTISFPVLSQGRYGDDPISLAATSNSALDVNYTVSGPAEFVGGVLSYTGVGTVSVTASQRGDALWNAADDVTQTIVVGRGIDSIQFDIAEQTYGVPFLLSATTRSGREPSFQVLAGDVLLEGLTAVAMSARSSVIHASLPASELWEAVDVDASFQVKKAPLHINFPAIATKSFAESGFTLQATTTEGLPVTFVVESGPIQITGAQVMFADVGVAKVTAFAAGNDVYADAEPVSQTFQITPGTQQITLAGLTDPQPFRTSIPMLAKATSGLPVTVSVQSGPATVSGDSLIPSGLGQVTLRATQAGDTRWLTASTTMTITLVQSDQTITFNPLPDVPLQTAATITLTATASSGLPVSYAVTGPATLQGTTLQLNGVGTVTVTASQPGDAHWLAAAPVVRAFNVSADLTPTASLSGTQSQNGWFSGTVTVTLAAPVATSTLQYQLDPSAAWETYVEPFPVTGDGTHVISFRVIGVDGKTGDTQTVSVPIDGSPPVATATVVGTKGNDDWYVSAVSVTFDATDDASGVASTTWRIGAGQPQTGATAGPFTQDGDVQLSYQATDNAGHTQPEQQLDLHIDVTPPHTTMKLTGTTGEGGWYTGAVTATAVAEDATSGVKSTSLRIDGGDWQSFDAPVVLSLPGKHQLRVRSEDVAGNVETEQQIEVDLDPEAPTLAVELTGTKGTNGWFVGPVTVAMETTAGLSGVATVQHRIDGGAWIDGTAPFTVSTDGQHTVDVAVVSEAGERTEQHLSVAIDATPPVVTATLGTTELPSNNGEFTDVQLTSTETDALDPQPLLDVSVTSNEPTIGGQPQWKMQDGKLLVRAEADPAGTGRLYTVTVTSIDAAGNRTQVVNTVSVAKAAPVKKSGCSSAGPSGLVGILVLLAIGRRRQRETSVCG